jgi:hypothetical protein
MTIRVHIATEAEVTFRNVVAASSTVRSAASALGRVVPSHGCVSVFGGREFRNLEERAERHQCRRFARGRLRAADFPRSRRFGRHLSDSRSGTPSALPLGSGWSESTTWRRKTGHPRDCPRVGRSHAARSPRIPELGTVPSADGGMTRVLVALSPVAFRLWFTVLPLGITDFLVRHYCNSPFDLVSSIDRY